MLRVNIITQCGTASVVLLKFELQFIRHSFVEFGTLLTKPIGSL